MVETLDVYELLYQNLLKLKPFLRYKASCEIVAGDKRLSVVLHHEFKQAELVFYPRRTNELAEYINALFNCKIENELQRAPKGV